jgi:magnesium transporter
MARTRVYRNGVLESQDFPVEQISDFLEDPACVVWLDVCSPDEHDLQVIGEELRLHRLAVEDAVQPHERPKLNRYESHLFVSAYQVDLDTDTGQLRTDRAKFGVAYLLHGLLDHVVDTYFSAVQALDDQIENLEDLLFDDRPHNTQVQRRSFEMRKSLVLLRRIVLPMREVVNAVMRRDLKIMDEAMLPYYQDVYDHVLRAADWTDSLRDLVTTILETNLTIQGNRLNTIMKQVTSWAAIIAVPTAITGYYGQNVPYPGFNAWHGFVTSTVLIVVCSAALYAVFRRRGWL